MPLRNIKTSDIALEIILNKYKKNSNVDFGQTKYVQHGGHWNCFLLIFY